MRIFQKVFDDATAQEDINKQVLYLSPKECTKLFAITRARRCKSHIVYLSEIPQLPKRDGTHKAGLTKFRRQWKSSEQFVSCTEVHLTMFQIHDRELSECMSGEKGTIFSCI